MIRTLICTFAVSSFLLSCASNTSTQVSVVADAKTFSHEGFKLQRPDGWIFVTPDTTVAKDTIALLQGPISAEGEAPYVEVSRRALSAVDRRRRPSHILLNLVKEVAQGFSGFEAQGEPQDITVAGKPGALMKMKYQEPQGDGEEVERRASFYGVVGSDAIWIVRCVESGNDARAAEFEQIVQSVVLKS